MKKKYIVPAVQIEKFHVEDIITESVTNVLVDGIKQGDNTIEFGDGNTLQSIDYKKFNN